jgi:hypothetical protein
MAHYFETSRRIHFPFTPLIYKTFTFTNILPCEIMRMQRKWNFAGAETKDQLLQRQPAASEEN